MRVLLATDGSPCSEMAVKEVARRPWPTGSEIKVISVVEPPVAATAEAGYLVPEYFREEENKAQAALDRAQSILNTNEDKMLKVTTEVATGSPKRVILDQAERWGADLIMVGSHGYGALKRFLMGSVSQAVALHAHCSVEIVRGCENK